MSMDYLPEQAENARLALEVAKKEKLHLAYTHRTLFDQEINLQWVHSLLIREDLARSCNAHAYGCDRKN